MLFINLSNHKLHPTAVSSHHPPEKSNSPALQDDDSLPVVLLTCKLSEYIALGYPNRLENSKTYNKKSDF